MFRLRVLIGATLASVATLAALAQSPVAPTTVTPTLQKTLADFDRFYEDGLRAQGIVGSSFVLLRDHRVVHRKNAGFADLATRQSIDDQTIFHWASITKTFTAINSALVMK